MCFLIPQQTALRFDMTLTEAANVTIDVTDLTGKQVL
jgi:hypothetical protein